MKRRIEYECLVAGQPRPYADTIHRYRVSFLSQGLAGYGDKDAPFKPDPFYSDAHKDRVEKALLGLQIGYVNTPPTDWADTRLDYLKVVSPGVWEFQTRDPYTD